MDRVGWGEEGTGESAYRETSGRSRRQFNLAFFKRLLIDDDLNVTGELAEPFDVLLGDELCRAVIAQERDELREAIEEVEEARGRNHESGRNEKCPRQRLALVGTEPPAVLKRGGFSPSILVRPSGLEPPPRLHRTRPSTLFARAIYVRPSPDRPFCAGSRTHRTHRTK